MKKAFTLIELLVVVLIIGILTSIALPNYMNSVEKARATEAMNVIKSLNDAVYAYAAEHNKCPVSFAKLLVNVPGSLNADGTLLTSKDFKYHLNAATNHPVAGTPCGGIIAERVNGKYKMWNPYIVLNAATKKRTLACTASSTDGIKICKSLGMYTTLVP